MMTNKFQKLTNLRIKHSQTKLNLKQAMVSLNKIRLLCLNVRTNFQMRKRRISKEYIKMIMINPKIGKLIISPFINFKKMRITTIAGELMTSESKRYTHKRKL